MTPKSLQTLFDAVHHGKYDYRDFEKGDVQLNYDRIFDKKLRPIYRPNKKLKAYHDFLKVFLCDFLTINERVVFSYRKGVTTHQAVAVHAHSRAFFQADITNFFGSIDRDLVMATFLERGSHVPISDLRNHLHRILDLTTVDGALPMGFSTSPSISNACLTGFDDQLESYCRQNELLYTRYADDIVVSAQSRDQLESVEYYVAEILGSLFDGKLNLNPAKRKLTSIGRKVKLLGMVITPSGRVTVDMELKKRIEVQLHFYVSDRDKFSSMAKHDSDAGVEKLAGYISYVNTADPLYLEKLRRKYGSTVIDSFLYRSAS